MRKINVGRVILGGLLAGLVINIGEFVLNGVILKADWDAAMKDLGKQPIGDQAIAYFVVGGFLLGIAILYLYAGIRPRFGASPKTALCAGLMAWFFASFYVTLGFWSMGIFPTRLLLIGCAWGLVELPLATVVGAWLYKEEG